MADLVGKIGIGLRSTEKKKVRFIGHEMEYRCTATKGGKRKRPSARASVPELRYSREKRRTHEGV